MSKDRPDLMGHWAVVALLTLLILPAMYFLSYGPMSRLYYATSNDAFDLVYEIFYLPVDLLSEYTPLGGPISWYEELWE
jgi:hypothetical protein